MSAPILHTTVFTDEGPKVIYFPKFAPPALLASYLRHIMPEKTSYYLANDTLLHPLASLTQSWITVPIVVTASSPPTVPDVMAHVLSHKERKTSKRAYKKWKKTLVHSHIMDALENPEDNTSIVSSKPKTLQFARKLEDVREFDEGCSAKSVSSAGECVFDDECTPEAITSGASATGSQWIKMQLKSKKLLEQLLGSDLLLGVQDINLIDNTITIQPPAEVPLLLKNMPKDRNALKYLKDLLKRMYARGISFTSTKAIEYIALSPCLNKLYFVLPNCLGTTSASMTEIQHRRKMIAVLLPFIDIPLTA